MDLIYHITAKVESEKATEEGGTLYVFHGIISGSWTDDFNFNVAVPVPKDLWKATKVGDEIVFRLSPATASLRSI